MKNLFYAARPILTDMLSTIVFAGLFALTSNIYVSTSAAIVMGVGQAAYEKLRGRPVPGMQWASLALVTVLGGATLFTGDPRFVMVKPTIIYLTIGAAMLQPGWMDRYMPPASKDYLPRRLIVAGGYVWSGLMFLTAALNLFIALTLDHKVWLAFIGVFPLASKLGLFAIHYATFRFIALRNYRAQEAVITQAQAA
ncbi:MAG TPA: septation protein IspZ [Caulobacteraceae bacterium]|jgi:intracellular septation protein A